MSDGQIQIDPVSISSERGRLRVAMELNASDDDPAVLAALAGAQLDAQSQKDRRALQLLIRRLQTIDWWRWGRLSRWRV